MCIVVIVNPNGEFIRTRRIERGYGLNEFARACGIDPGNLSRIERGQSGARMATLRRIAQELGVSISEIAAA
jgi:transcriptional regulator with XRE-family HTH domain